MGGLTSTWPISLSSGHDWSNYIKYVVRDLEGDLAESTEQRREHELREKIADVTPCNIRAESFLDSKTEVSQFDVVHTNLCLEIACETQEEFCKCLGKLGDLLKPGGYFVMLTAKGGRWYTCAGAGDKLFQLKLEEADIVEAVKMSGMYAPASLLNIQLLAELLSRGDRDGQRPHVLTGCITVSLLFFNHTVLLSHCLSLPAVSANCCRVFQMTKIGNHESEVGGCCVRKKLCFQKK